MLLAFGGCWRASARLGNSGRCPQATLHGSRTELNAMETSVVGALAGAVTGVLTTPLDVIKTRMMTQGSSGRYLSIADCASKIVREEGAAAFFKASAPELPHA